MRLFFLSITEHDCEKLHHMSLGMVLYTVLDISLQGSISDRLDVEGGEELPKVRDGVCGVLDLLTGSEVEDLAQL